jgi:hypothetical protein
MSDDGREKDHSEQSWVIRVGQAARECISGMQGIWLFSRQFLPVQGII